MFFELKTLKTHLDIDMGRAYHQRTPREDYISFFSRVNSQILPEFPIANEAPIIKLKIRKFENSLETGNWRMATGDWKLM